MLKFEKHSAQFSRSVLSDSLRPHGLQHARPPCPSPTPRVYSDSCPLSWWYRPTISSSVVPFSSCLWSFPASGSFQMSQFFASGGQIHPKKKKFNGLYLLKILFAFLLSFYFHFSHTQFKVHCFSLWLTKCFIIGCHKSNADKHSGLFEI